MKMELSDYASYMNVHACVYMRYKGIQYFYYTSPVACACLCVCAGMQLNPSIVPRQSRK